MTSQTRSQHDVVREDGLFLLFVLLAGLIPVVAVMLHQEAWGVEPTIGLVMVIYAASVLALGLLSGLHRWRSRRPH